MLSRALFDNTKIVHLINSLGNGGAEGILRRICLNSNIYSHSVIYFLSDDVHSSILKKAGISVYCLNADKKNPIRLFYELLLLLKSLHPSLVQTWMYHSCLIGGLACKTLGIPVVWTIRRSALSVIDAKLNTIIINYILSLLSRFIPSAIVFCSTQGYRWHVNHGYRESISSCIYNGCDTQYFCPSYSNPQKYVVNPISPIIGSLARFHPSKGQSTLLKALSLLTSVRADFTCLLAGPGIDESNSTLVELIRINKLNDNVILLGACSDVPSFMNSLSLFVSSSITEGFPNVLLEAMSCCVRSIATDVGDTAEILDGHCSLVPPSQPQLLADAIHKYLLLFEANSIPLRCQLIRERVVQLYSLESMVRAYEDLWSNILSD